MYAEGPECRSALESSGQTDWRREAGLECLQALGAARPPGQVFPSLLIAAAPRNQGRVDMGGVLP